MQFIKAEIDRISFSSISQMNKVISEEILKKIKCSKKIYTIR